MSTTKQPTWTNRFASLIDEALAATCGTDRLPVAGRGEMLAFGQDLAGRWARNGFRGNLAEYVTRNAPDEVDSLRYDDPQEKRAKAFRAPAHTDSDILLTRDNGQVVAVAKVEEVEHVEADREQNYLRDLGWLLKQRADKRVFVGLANKEDVGNLISTLKRRADEEGPLLKGTTAVVLFPTDTTAKEGVWLILFEEGRTAISWRPWGSD